MEIVKILIRDSEIPVQKGAVRLVEYEDELSIDDDECIVEVEVNVHPTVGRFLESITDFRERVIFLTKENQRITGLFNVYINNERILFIGDPSLVNGISHIAPVPFEKNPLQIVKSDGIPLDTDLSENTNQQILHVLDVLVQQDYDNQQFISRLKDKIKKGESLSAFELYIKKEIGRYLVEVFS
ncbi:hypothetical protein [uncultured Rummeliibacillus sp.]|uniref:hypothetical protein n=1 Tax=uncultured Rummeliibacillus sp. TaxID=762292 RepID=UPI00261174F4|nr:hypothetical protein [uncultured Rummeliibacillus sp.]